MATIGFVSTWVSFRTDGDNWGVYAQRHDQDGNQIGPEFLVNTTTVNNQTDPSVAMLLDGGFVITWVDSEADGSEEGIFAQRYDANGDPVGGEVQINQGTHHIQDSPSIIGLDDGGYVISWTSFDASSNYDLYAQRFDANGDALGAAEYKVNTTIYNEQFDSKITGLNDGGYLVTWTSQAQDGRGWGVFGQRYDENNTPVGSEFQINTYSTNNQSSSDVTRLDNGGFVVVWSSYGQNAPDATVRDGIYGQVFDENGVPVGGEVQINTEDEGIQWMPSVASTGDGGFITVWASQDQDGDRWGVYGQKMDATGQPVGSEFLVNTETYAEQYEPVVSSLENGGVIVNWTSDEQDGHANGIFGQILDQDGNPVGSEFKVNNTTYHVQENPDVGGFDVYIPPPAPVAAPASGGNEGFVVTWLSFRHEGEEGFPPDQDWAVYAQRFDADGVAIGGEFRVNTFDYGNQTDPKVTSLSDGGFVIVWVSNEQDGQDEGIFGQRYDANGEAVGTEFQINTYTQGIQFEPEVTGLTEGGFVVSWSSFAQDGRGFGIFAQNFDAAGVETGPEYQVNSYALLEQDNSSVTALSDGGYVVTWSSYGQDGRGDGVFGQRFDASGQTVGQEFAVNSHHWNNQNETQVAALSDGGFAVVWQSDRQDGSDTGIYVQQFNINGETVGVETRVNTTTQGDQSYPVVAGLEGGGYVVAWTSFYGQDGDRRGIFAQQFDAQGAPVGQEFMVNQETYLDQERVDIAALSNGGFIITWDSDKQDGSEEGVYGRMYDQAGVALDDEFLVNEYTDHIQAFSSVSGLQSAAPLPSDTLFGTAGDDLLTGTSGDDTLYGGLGNDVILGEAGDDLIYAGLGQDTLTGGAGGDTYVFTSAAQADGDVITDFDVTEDVIDLSQIETPDGTGVYSFTYLPSVPAAPSAGDVYFDAVNETLVAVLDDVSTTLEIELDGLSSFDPSALIL